MYFICHLKQGYRPTLMTFLPPASEGLRKVMVSPCTPSWREGVIPILPDWMPPPHRDWMGYPPPPPIGRQSSIASTCYAEGSMPLAFTQEDFLVDGFNDQFSFWNISIALSNQNNCSKDNHTFDHFSLI